MNPMPRARFCSGATRLCLLSGLALLALSLSSPARAERRLERRVVVFHDGKVPRIEASGDKYVHGELEIEIQFVNTNPLCFAYSVNGKAVPESRSRSDQSIADEMVLASAEGTLEFTSLEKAETALRARMQDLATLREEATSQASLAPAWEACLWADPPSRVINVQRKHISEVDKLLRLRLGSSGAWTRILLSSVDTLTSVRRQVFQLSSADEASPAGQMLRDKVFASMEALERYIAATLSLVRQLQDDLQQAQTRLASTPASTTRSVSTNRRVTIEIERARLDQGQLHPALDTITVTSEAYETLSPILFNIGLGPSLTFENRKEYGLGQNHSDQRPNIMLTENSANIDVVVSLSVYLWGYRYLNDDVLAARQFAPRPMLGLSLHQPFSSIYFGLQIDPLQFLDISFGARMYSASTLVNAHEGQVAIADADGNAAPPMTQSRMTTQMFVALTASTDLFHRWIKRSLY